MVEGACVIARGRRYGKTFCVGIRRSGTRIINANFHCWPRLCAYLRIAHLARRVRRRCCHLRSWQRISRLITDRRSVTPWAGAGQTRYLKRRR